MNSAPKDEWNIIESLLPPGWKEAAREQGAFRRARYTTDPGSLLRLLLFHAVNDAGLRETVAQAEAGGIAQMSQVALLKRLRTSGKWLAWLCARMCQGLRDAPRLPDALRLRVVDSTTVQGPAAKGAQWRVHYALDLRELTCDWCELTDVSGAELLERTPMQRGDVLLGDRSYLRSAAVRMATKAKAYVLLRLRWTHTPMQDEQGRSFQALAKAKRLRVGQVGEWPVLLDDRQGKPIPARVVITKLPAPLAAKAERRLAKRYAKRNRTPHPNTLQAAHYVMLFTTLSKEQLTAEQVLELYRYRWQVELAFKRHKQLLKLGRLPHKDAAAAQSWILAKLLMALVLETLYRNAKAISPWGFSFCALAA
jgi:IS4 transposase